MAIANFYEAYRYFNDSINLEISTKSLSDNMVKLMKLMIPFTPHLAHECLTNLSCEDLNEWPKIDEKIFKNLFILSLIFLGFLIALKTFIY